jgi:serine/threonine protein kinase
MASMADTNSAKSIFLAAVEIPSDERAAYLDQATAGDAALRARVEALLAAHENPGSFLESPAIDIAVTTNMPSIVEQPGTVIGPYKLLQQIGEGGMGVVFMAEQAHPLQRTVALKIIKPGMDTRQVIARFEAERQAVAMMDHPNIAKVLDAGTTDTGRPYFVMELVKGVPITKYCDEKHLPLGARLELFVQVCQAVQHAHQKGIIHRDIKPNNVLVAEYDNRAVPKVIDFGVAKATAQKLTERTMFTEFGQVIGTVEYMSPEQAKLNQLDIDTRSDIYSLGVLLYELLTGSTPIELQRLRSAAFDEMLRIIREEEPPKPSLRLSTSDTLPSIAANRHSEPANLSRDLQGELDWIAMMCLEKDRNRRYESASGLGRDIERYLHDEPVHACPPSTAYRVKKIIRRNKLPVAAAAALTLTLMLGIIGTTWQSIRATHASALARQEADKEQAINQFLREMLQSANPWARSPADAFKGRDATVVQVCDAAVARLDAVALKDRPEVEAALRATIGETYGSLGRGEEGEVQLREAVRLARIAYGPDNPEQPGYTATLAKHLSNRGVKLDEAEALMRDRLRIRKNAYPDLDFSDGMNNLAQILLRKSEVKHDANGLAEAEQIARQIDRPLLLADVLKQQGR